MRNNNLPPGYVEQPEQALRCHDCGCELCEDAVLAYWELNPYGDGDPRCLDCLSQIDPADITVRRERHLLSTALFLLALAAFVSAAFYPMKAGYCLMAAVGLANVGLMARICRK